MNRLVLFFIFLTILAAIFGFGALIHEIIQFAKVLFYFFLLTVLALLLNNYRVIKKQKELHHLLTINNEYH
jgi:hypothetical protein